MGEAVEGGSTFSKLGHVPRFRSAVCQHGARGEAGGVLKSSCSAWRVHGEAERIKTKSSAMVYPIVVLVAALSILASAQGHPRSRKFSRTCWRSAASATHAVRDQRQRPCAAPGHLCDPGIVGLVFLLRVVVANGSRPSDHRPDEAEAPALRTAAGQDCHCTVVPNAGHADGLRRSVCRR